MNIPTWLGVFKLLENLSIKLLLLWNYLIIISPPCTTTSPKVTPMKSCFWRKILPPHTWGRRRMVMIFKKFWLPESMHKYNLSIYLPIHFSTLYKYIYIHISILYIYIYIYYIKFIGHHFIFILLRLNLSIYMYIWKTII